MNTASPSTGSRMTVQQVMDDRPMNSRRWLIVLLCFVVALLDGFDTQSIAFIGSSIAADFGMAATDMTWVITASTIGMALGAMTLGSAGDRFGRKRTIIVALTIFGVFSILGAFAQTTWQIIALRFLIGLGMGGATPSLLALVAEYSHQKRRGLSMSLVLLGLPGGALLGGVVAAEWLPILGWRGMFLLGGVLPVIMIAVMFFCPESPGYLVARGRPGDQTKARMLIHQATKVPVDQSTALVPELGGQSRGSIAALFDQKYRATTIAVGAVYLANWIAWFLLLQWMPTALHMLGLSTSDAAFGTIVVNGAFILFSFPISFLLPRVQLRKLLLGMFTVGILVSLGLGLAGSQWTVIFVLIALAGLGIGGQQLVLNYLVAGTYSTELRGVATGFSIGVGRLGSIVGSALGGTLLAAFGPNGYFAVLAVPLAIAAIATVLVRAPKAPSSH